MTFLQKTTQAFTVLLVSLVFLVSSMLVLPPGMVLELCFGNDGHVDLSLGSCQDCASPKLPARERPPIYDATHHDDCLHKALVCSTAQELIRTDGKTDDYKSKLKKDPSKTPLLLPESRADSAGAYFNSNVYSIFFKNFPSPQLVSLRTVVLLI